MNQIAGASRLGSLLVQEMCHPAPPASAALRCPGGKQSPAACEDAFSSTGHLRTEVLLVWLAQVAKIGSLVGLVAIAVVLPFAVTGKGMTERDSDFSSGTATFSLYRIAL